MNSKLIAVAGVALITGAVIGGVALDRLSPPVYAQGDEVSVDGQAPFHPEDCPGVMGGGMGKRGGFHKKGPRLTEEQRQQMDEIFANRDYEAWKAFMQELPVPEDRPNAARVLEVVTAENFDQLAQAHDLMQEGKQLMQDGDKDGAKAKFEEAREIKEAMGLKGPGMGKKAAIR